MSLVGGGGRGKKIIIWSLSILLTLISNGKLVLNLYSEHSSAFYISVFVLNVFLIQFALLTFYL